MAGSGRQCRWRCSTRRTSRSCTATSSIPAIYHKDLIRGHHQAARPGEAEAQTKERSAREFQALQASPFFDVWASAAVDEILSALHETLVIGKA